MRNFHAQCNKQKQNHFSNNNELFTTLSMITKVMVEEVILEQGQMNMRYNLSQQ